MTADDISVNPLETGQTHEGEGVGRYFVRLNANEKAQHLIFVICFFCAGRHRFHGLAAGNRVSFSRYGKRERVSRPERAAPDFRDPHDPDVHLPCLLPRRKAGRPALDKGHDNETKGSQGIL